uniref:Uncharacterized protein n=1 Tax=Oncorhynchus tshawytscha TaxID=74940 RepID=A0A8C8CKG8_ONCTS
REPVSLGCHHSFCASCLDKFWDQTKNKNCPVCRRKCSKDHLNVNFQLKELSDKYAGRQKAGEKDSIPDEGRAVVCPKHTDEPKWFCEVEQRAVCHVCEFAAHHSHTVIPLEQAVKYLKEKLTSELHSLQSKQILREEEEARLAAMRKEEEEKGKMIAREMKNIQDQISLTENITAVKQKLQKQEVPFLKSYKHTQTFSRAQDTLPDPQLVSGALIDVAKHLGNLQFRVWEKIQGIVKYTPVILDPNAAHPCLSLSDDLTSVSQTVPTQQLPDNPERNTNHATVLCSEGFSSGRHSWEVEVGDHPYWFIGLVKGTYWVGGRTITLKRRPQRIRVQLDCDRGEVSFYDAKDMTHIYTLTLYNKGGYLVSCTTVSCTTERKGGYLVSCTTERKGGT